MNERKENLSDRIGPFPERKAAEKESFWTKERIFYGEKIFETIKKELKPFGIPQITFDPNLISLFHYPDFETYFMERHLEWWQTFSSERERIKLPVCPSQGESTFVKALIDETTHFFSTKTLRNGEPYRDGAKIYNQKKRNFTLGHFERYLEEGWKNEYKRTQDYENKFTPKAFFIALSDGILTETSNEIFKRNFPDMQYDYWRSTLELEAFGQFGPNEDVVESFANPICWVISQKLKESFASPKKAFTLFQKAAFGDGNCLPLAHILEKIGGKDSFKKFHEIMVFYDYTSITKGGSSLFLFRNSMEEEFLTSLHKNK